MFSVGRIKDFVVLFGNLQSV